MGYKKMVRLWFAIVLPVLVAVLLFNLYIDPLWCFSHSNRWNNHQPGFNERQQKTNRIHFTGLKSYDTLMLGSSRTAYVNQHDFHGMKVFNYGADNMLPWEYEKWIDIATHIKGKTFKRVILGIDFFGSAKNYDPFIDRYYDGRKPKDYLRNTLQPLYRLKSLLNFDALKHSWESVEHTLHPTISDYDRKNVRHCNIVIPPDKKAEYIRDNIREYRDHLGKNYHYRAEWPEMLRRLQRKYPQTRFIVFTTPVSRPFYEAIVLDNHRIEDYRRWLRDTVEATGQVYHFMDLNSVTNDLDNFFDAHHLYARSVRWIAHRISDHETEEIPEDFGKLLTPKNLQEYFDRWQEAYYTPSR